MNTETAKAVARDARLLLDALNTGFPHNKHNLVQAAMPALIARAEDKPEPRGEFSEEQVRRALRGSLRRQRSGKVETLGLYYSVDTFLLDVISRLRGAEKPAEPAEGGVYRRRGSEKGPLYMYSGGSWSQFGTSVRLATSAMFTDDLERVL